ncbi:hypothetical protein PFLUV_G00052910 [Perca fluviatilis]|uniref:Uncharacterized protein n=1 Tax=Perca fluviatilis TaxID=8168 RepID=A0A6A5FG40_PERFL|nr:hypothetical protein PFLUV_G00052910 [Perca fluviatilis]
MRCDMTRLHTAAHCTTFTGGGENNNFQPPAGCACACVCPRSGLRGSRAAVCHHKSYNKDNSTSTLWKHGSMSRPLPALSTIVSQSLSNRWV